MHHVFSFCFSLSFLRADIFRNVINKSNHIDAEKRAYNCIFFFILIFRFIKCVCVCVFFIVFLVKFCVTLVKYGIEKRRKTHSTHKQQSHYHSWFRAGKFFQQTHAFNHSNKRVKRRKKHILPIKRAKRQYCI